MKFLKWFGIFAVAFLVAWILIFTFNQEPFKAKVPAQIITYQTPPVAIYIYLSGAFLVGFLIGLWIAIYNFITLKSKLAKTSKKINSSEHQISQLTMDLENCRAQLSSLQQRFEQIQKEKSDKTRNVALDLKETNDAE